MPQRLQSAQDRFGSALGLLSDVVTCANASHYQALYYSAYGKNYKIL